ncbi:MAG: hypothetical protein KZQ74_05675, partial [gamma proteobacterium symbiont of Bathyaustriella thionipta]|nr:hypothetical protein [gamma proteobacterium symbiont of Bathyaustriella thionipta]MCU7951147.1 hypothetical protein [gamma proteobacterium symbiont of Bathyaustriella thionipta]MCU7957660.1 hypothetical protein [gamma proteobacterium symbiont of Bathyaustriella thionipta]MCU7966674.1 hypothetical protein [gamma proteobacterium symbiont of Bathyaustriella thionipta]
HFIRPFISVFLPVFIIISIAWNKRMDTNYGEISILHETVLKYRAPQSEVGTVLTISQDDYDEFFRFNRNLDDMEAVKKEIIVGASWPLRSHQYRRSIAVHSRRLKLVSNNTLTVQFKHLASTMTEWYCDGHQDEDTVKYKIPKLLADELQVLEAEMSAELAMRFQEGETLVGKGGENLIAQQKLPKNQRTFPSFKRAVSMAKRGRSVVISLGNGFYCMNGRDCDMKAIVQSSLCNPGCESLVADAESIPIWLHRFKHYDKLLKKAKTDVATDATITFLQLERDYYANALDQYEVKYAKQ